MLGEELVNPQGFGRARQVVEWRVALEERHHIAEALQNGQQFAEAPDAGVVQRLGGGAPLAPEPFERAGVGPVRASVPAIRAPHPIQRNWCRLSFMSLDSVPANGGFWPPARGDAARECTWAGAVSQLPSLRVSVREAYKNLLLF